jgi:hypothetical protein
MDRVVSLVLGLMIASAPVATADVITISGTVDLSVQGDAGPQVEIRAELVPVVGNHEWATGVLEGRASPPMVAEAVADDEGRFALEAPGAGIWSVVLRADGRVPMRYAPLPVVERLELPPVQMLRDVGARVEVKGRDGQPSSGVWVLVETASQELWSRTAVDGWRIGARIGQTGPEGSLLLPRAEGEKVVVNAFGAQGLSAAVRGRGGSILSVLPEPSPDARLIEALEPGASRWSVR